MERHLRACHECRQLAEALRPAVALLHEAVAADEAQSLPEYQGALPWKRPDRQRLSLARLAPVAKTRPAVRARQTTIVRTSFPSVQLTGGHSDGLPYRCYCSPWVFCCGSAWSPNTLVARTRNH